MLQFLLLLKITRMLEGRLSCMYIQLLERLMEKAWSLRFLIFFSNKFKTKSIICFDIGLDNLYHCDCVFDIILRSYFDSSFDIDIFLRTMKFEEHNGWKIKEKSTRLYQIISRLIVKNLIEVKIITLTSRVLRQVDYVRC